MYRFFVDESQIADDVVIITGSDVKHIKNVLRMKPGERVLISNGQDREYKCVLTEMTDKSVTAKIEDVDGPARELSVKVTLFQALPKGDKMDTVIQKMVELGVYEIVPVSTKRCIVKLDDKKAAAKRKRWNAIAESAAKQSKRGIVPKVSEPLTYRLALERAAAMDVILVPYEEAEDMEHTREIMSTIQPGMQVGVFIGPEGGFTKEEVEEAVAKGAHAITLGKRILRTETAGMALMSVIMFQCEDEIVKLKVDKGQRDGSLF